MRHDRCPVVACYPGGKKRLKPLQQEIRLTLLAPTGSVLGRGRLSTCQPLLLFITVIRQKNLISVSRGSAIPRLAELT
jgi:hypothetical protein